ncbi:MAG: tRNA 4-thiouridine(8) synthase ThiI [Clostridiales bacterium]|nr:tRNA 4-thiouridine(8) synthase ThiI [Clostridiales bacterium]
MTRFLLVKYAEVHLKGQNRPYFQRLLLRNIRQAVAPHGGEAVFHDSRIFVTDYSDENACIDSIRKVFGVHAVSPAIQMGKEDFNAIAQQAADMMGDEQGSFKVVARRADKRFFLESPEICAKIGAHVLKNNPQLTVDVRQPDHILNVEIRDNALLYTKSFPAVGGLPTGSAGKAMLLLSGGIDSPVAGFRIAKRGVQLSAVYYHSFPYTGEAVKEKIIALARLLSAYCGTIKLHVVPFTEIQQAIHEKCPEDFTTLIMRRNMMRIADMIARQEKALALITGESIGQVASQTLEALVCTDAVVSRPVFRPLIGMDKLEIIREAEAIGTYETSCLPYEDCCTVFTPRHPVTHPKLKQAEFAERPLIEDDGLDHMIERAIQGTETLLIEPKP